MYVILYVGIEAAAAVESTDTANTSTDTANTANDTANTDYDTTDTFQHIYI